MKNRIIALLMGIPLFLLPIFPCGSNLNHGTVQDCVVDSSGGPDAYGYVWIDIYEPGGPVYNWIDITGIGTKVEGLTDDNNTGPFQIGFDFPYYGYDRNQFWVNANGAISFSDAEVYVPQGSSGFTIPGFNHPNDLIIPLGADLIFAGVDSAECYYYTNNVDTLIVSYINVAAWNNGPIGAHTFQLILTRQDSCIYFQYGTQEGQFYNNADCAGIEDYGGSIGLQVFLYAMPDSGYAVKFIPPDSVSGVKESEDRKPKTRDIRLTCHPNPYSTSTTISFERLSEHQNISESELQIYDVFGRRVRDFILYPWSHMGWQG
ncbi:hypothetical protein KAU34_03425 [candidate division WOR-3 bacterium]|nr:hypothetical protein [candidate division WOR-3 bacterium]